MNRGAWMLAALVVLGLVACSSQSTSPELAIVKLTGMLRVVEGCVIPEGCGPKYALFNEGFTTAVPLLGPLQECDQVLVSVEGRWVEPPPSIRWEDPYTTRYVQVESFHRRSRIRYHDFLVPAARDQAQRRYGCALWWNKTLGWELAADVPVIWVRLTNTSSAESPQPWIEFRFDADSGELRQAADNLGGRSPCDM